jgi:hypothetical protein
MGGIFMLRDNRRDRASGTLPRVGLICIHDSNVLPPTNENPAIVHLAKPLQ